MLVSPVPYIVILASLAPVAGGLLIGRRWAIIAGIGLMPIVYLAPMILLVSEGEALLKEAMRGNARAQFQYSRWLENYPDSLQNRIVWPVRFDFEQSWRWLDTARRNGDLEAMYAEGVRLKEDDFVDKKYRALDGQELVEEALRRGFVPPCSEKVYYWTVYRQPGKYVW